MNFFGIKVKRNGDIFPWNSAGKKREIEVS